MRPHDLDDMPAAPREAPEVCLWRGLRQRLQALVNKAGKHGEIYINGKTFAAEHVQFIIDNFNSPKPN